ncbi:[protein-PII] uridylyltransferase [Snodgrassella sp. CFCC 13594]|uniref:[protein-PII] uridylyltransferase n=1 Tax=Snodgrassella sp. CFCC 13594 TaxID=1775559 RepID=UPI001E4F9B19|nr:[protein-PII] uridylyltransferase [Snodgrassella sp. CFCC 13594]
MAILESALGALWQDYFQGQNMCLMAIGGFGRGEMYPFSDMDIALVTATPPDEATQENIAEFIQVLWDMHMLPAPKVGSLVQLCESAREDLTSDTAFLEARFICGNHRLAQQFVNQLNLQRDVASFIEGKLLEQQQRYAKAQGAGSLLEANVKTAPGGLRDVHTLVWLAKAQGLNAQVNNLVQQNIVTRTEAGLLTHSHKQLAKIRIDLHLAAGRPEERLIFDLQAQVALNLGFTDDVKYRASEKLMRAFYRATKTIKQLSGILLPMLRGRVYSALPRIVVDIDEDYYQVGNLLAVKDKKLFQKKPTHLFKAMYIAQQHNDIVGLAPQTLRSWWRVGQKIGSEFYDNPVNRDRFIGFFRRGDGLTHLLRFMNLYGILGRYLPAWGKIVGLLQHDLFHIYPVDDHILMVVRNMRRLAMDAHSHELPYASGLMHSFERKHILYLAALFHDIAKGRGGDHAEKGVADARQFGEDHFLSEEETELLAWLVQEHLLMSITAQKEDIQDPEVVAKFARVVQTHERLVALYLLTVADIRGTNPKIWNSWKASLLESLFQATLRLISGEKRDRAVVVNNRQQRAINELARLNVSAAKQRELWHLLGEAYFVRHEIQEILWQLPKLVNHEHEAQAHTQLLPNTDTMQVMVYMPNRPKLFAGLSYIFSRHELNILAARAYVTEHNYILDTFILQMPNASLPQDYQRIQHKVEHSLDQFVKGELTPHIDAPAKPLGRRSRHLPIAPRVSIYEEDNAGWYILEIITFNRRYLLSNIAEVMSDFGISIRYAKIATLDERVEDSFLIYAPKLEDTQQRLALKTALLKEISQ